MRRRDRQSRAAEMLVRGIGTLGGDRSCLAPIWAMRGKLSGRRRNWHIALLVPAAEVSET